MTLEILVRRLRKMALGFVSAVVLCSGLSLMLCSHAVVNRIFSTCELVFTSVLRSSAFVVVMW